MVHHEEPSVRELLDEYRILSDKQNKSPTEMSRMSRIDNALKNMTFSGSELIEMRLVPYDGYATHEGVYKSPQYTELIEEKERLGGEKEKLEDKYKKLLARTADAVRAFLEPASGLKKILDEEGEKI